MLVKHTGNVKCFVAWSVTATLRGFSLFQGMRNEPVLACTSAFWQGSSSLPFFFPASCVLLLRVSLSLSVSSAAWSFAIFPREETYLLYASLIFKGHDASSSRGMRSTGGGGSSIEGLEVAQVAAKH